MKYYVLADIHGFYDLTVNALTEQGYFADREPHKLIICGDLFDRGKQCKQLCDFITGLLEKDEVILIRGNHEDLLVDLIDNLRMYTEDGLQFSHHFLNGTVYTVRDLTGSTLTKMREYPGATAAGMRQSAVFKKILPAMKDYFETRNYIFVHGWIPSVVTKRGNADYYAYNPDWRNAGIDEWESARWYNGMLAAHQGVTEAGKTIVCGHWTSSFGHWAYEGKGSEFGNDADFSPYYNKGIIALDACTAYSGKVNCVVIEDDECNASP